MKKLALALSIGLLIMGQAITSSAQVRLPEVTIVPASYKYLNAVNNEEIAQPVEMLQIRAATYNVKNSEFYEDDYDTYFVSFYLPEGVILASYNKEGKLLRTAERYTNVKMPSAVTRAIGKRFPGWFFSKNTYLVNYYDTDGAAVKTYKVLLENGDQRIKIKINENGEFM